MYELETSGIVVQTGTHGSDTYIQVNSCGDEATNCVCALIVQIPAWSTARRVLG